MPFKDILIISKENIIHRFKGRFRTLSMEAANLVELPGIHCARIYLDVSKVTVTQMLLWTEHYCYSPPKIAKEYGKPEHLYVSEFSPWDIWFFQKASI